MLQKLLAHSADLERLRNEGYELSLSPSNNHLLVGHVPYVNAARQVDYGVLVVELRLNGNTAIQPPDHVAQFIGQQPCDVNGVEIGSIKHPEGRQETDKGLWVDRKFSGKPETPFQDYYEKVTRYLAILGAPARAIDATATAKTHRPNALSENDSVFKYADTASSRAGISALSIRLELARIAIIGVGGTGSYVLDFVAKTPVKEIHLWDGDDFSSHNAFRSPGAASLAELKTQLKKTVYLERIYQKMRRGIVSHDHFVSMDDFEELKAMDFVFLCLDQGDTKRALVELLLDANVPFVDVGMGVEKTDDKLSGVLRVTTRSKARSDHIRTAVRLGDGDVNDEYTKNIQIAELNALNAVLAVIKWKKLCGFYHDLENEHSTHYSVSHNTLLNQYPA